MSWRNNLRVNRSRIEDLIEYKLNQYGLNQGYTSTGDPGNIIEFTPEEIEEFRVHATEADGAYFNLSNPIILFYDGPHHRKLRQEQKDEKIDEVLEARGFKVLRFPYSRPNKTLVLKIVKQIAQNLYRYGYPKDNKQVKYVDSTNTNIFCPDCNKVMIRAFKRNSQKVMYNHKQDSRCPVINVSLLYSGNRVNPHYCLLDVKRDATG